MSNETEHIVFGIIVWIIGVFIWVARSYVEEWEPRDWVDDFKHNYPHTWRLSGLVWPWLWIYFAWVLSITLGEMLVKLVIETAKAPIRAVREWLPRPTPMKHEKGPYR